MITTISKFITEISTGQKIQQKHNMYINIFMLLLRIFRPSCHVLSIIRVLITIDDNKTTICPYKPITSELQLKNSTIKKTKIKEDWKGELLNKEINHHRIVKKKGVPVKDTSKNKRTNKTNKQPNIKGRDPLRVHRTQHFERNYVSKRKRTLRYQSYGLKMTRTRLKIWSLKL